MNVTLDPTRQAASAAPEAGPDPLAVRLARLRAAQRAPGWAGLLLALARELTQAEAGAVLARGEDGWTALAPEVAEAPPAAWRALAEAATDGRRLAAAPAATPGRWLFAAALGPADPAGGGPAALVVEVAATGALDLALTRERMAALGALAEASGAEAAARDRAPFALAAAAAEALLDGGGDAAGRARGLHRAAAILAGSLPGAERVAIVLRPGRRGGGAIGLSDQAAPLPAAELPRRLLALAEEAVDRAAPRAFAPAGPLAPSPAERAYAAAFGPRPLLSVPAAEATLVVAFAPGTTPAPETGERLLPAASLLGALAAARPVRPGVAAWRRRGRWVLGLAALLGALALWPRPHDVAAPFVLQPERARSVTAPFDGILDASAAQPGDPVEAGRTPLARIVTREVELELAGARARVASDRRDAAVARAAGQPAQEQIALLAARRGEAQVALLENRIAQADIRAPVDGTIVAGDLRRSLGQPLQRGQVLFEIALPGPLRAEIMVLDEHIPAVAPGQPVRLSTAAEPGRIRHATVLRVRPMAELVQGRNAFRVLAALDATEAQAGLRPGMEGWARIETGRTSWLEWILRDPVRWARRVLWI